MFILPSVQHERRALVNKRPADSCSGLPQIYLTIYWSPCRFLSLCVFIFFILGNGWLPGAGWSDRRMRLSRGFNLGMYGTRTKIHILCQAEQLTSMELTKLEATHTNPVIWVKNDVNVYCLNCRSQMISVNWLSLYTRWKYLERRNWQHG